MAHKNFDSLRKAILEKAKQGMKSESLPLAKSHMSKAIEKEVYAVYTTPPRKYVRRHERGVSGGLNDKKNMIGNVINERKFGFNFSVENITMPNSPNAPEEYLTPLIVLGQLGDTKLKYHYGAETYPYGQPRNYISETVETMNKDKKKFVKALNDFMNK